MDPEKLMTELSSQLSATLKAMAKAKTVEEKKQYSEIVKNLSESLQLLPLWTGRAVNFVTSGSGWPFFHSPRGKSGMSHGLNR